MDKLTSIDWLIEKGRYLDLWSLGKEEIRFMNFFFFVGIDRLLKKENELSFCMEEGFNLLRTTLLSDRIFSFF